jgi:hypothetical protein
MSGISVEMNDAWRDSAPTEPSKFNWTTLPWHECKHCHRQTITGLCGCSVADPTPIGQVQFGVPREASNHSSSLPRKRD